MSSVHPVLSRAHPVGWVLMVSMATVGNIVLERLAQHLNLPLFMDTIFTAVVAVSSGFVAAVVVGAGTNIALEIITGGQQLFSPFIVNNVVTGVLVWLFLRYHYLEKPIHAVAATLVVAGVNSAFGAVFAASIQSGLFVHPIDHIVAGIMLTGRSYPVAAFLARIPINTVDKGIAVFAAYLVHRRLTRPEPLV